LLQSIPHTGARIKDRLAPIPGSVPDPFSIPEGCAFRTRCPAITAQCQADAPMIEVEPGHHVRCCLYA
jgi:oligopeptide/dipeptide ABC transporter ATP-binding protein